MFSSPEAKGLHALRLLSQACVTRAGVTGMMDRLDNPSKVKAAHLSEELKGIMKPLYDKHQVEASSFLI